MLTNRTVIAEVASDGTFRGTATIGQPLFPAGSQRSSISCERSSSPHQVVRAREVVLDVVAPPLPDLTVVAGSTIDYVLPCTIGALGPGSFWMVLTAPGLPDVGLSMAGTFPYPGSTQEGDVVDLAVPDAAPGTYAASARCSGPKVEILAFWTGFTVTIVAPVPPSTAPPGPPDPASPSGTGAAPAAAPGAAPVRGRATYTG